ncbi:hypothetical protein HY485_03180 [Candidatus Woesearchaeota archaeon]|nr:hypothetical protein [Candidatus Woesearchaeota archaeon]
MDETFNLAMYVTGFVTGLVGTFVGYRLGRHYAAPTEIRRNECSGAITVYSNNDVPTTFVKRPNGSYVRKDILAIEQAKTTAGSGKAPSELSDRLRRKDSTRNKLGE